MKHVIETQLYTLRIPGSVAPEFNIPQPPTVLLLPPLEGLHVQVFGRGSIPTHTSGGGENPLAEVESFATAVAHRIAEKHNIPVATLIGRYSMAEQYSFKDGEK